MRVIFMGWFRFRFRKVLIDFHTPEFAVEAVKNFNAKKWVEVLKKANVNALVFFAQDAYGNAYFPTKVGHKHRGVTQDMLGEIIKEAHEIDIKVIAYVNTRLNRHAATLNPDWAMRDPEGNPIRSGPRSILVCLNSPYVEEWLFPLVEEIVRNYDIDGFFFDRGSFQGLCYCDYCKAKFAREYGVEPPTNPRDPMWWTYVRWQLRKNFEFVKELRRRVKAIKPEVEVGFNGVFAMPSPFFKLGMDWDYVTSESHNPLAHSFAGGYIDDFIFGFIRNRREILVIIRPRLSPLSHPSFAYPYQI